MLKQTKSSVETWRACVRFLTGTPKKSSQSAYTINATGAAAGPGLSLLEQSTAPFSPSPSTIGAPGYTSNILRRTREKTRSTLVDLRKHEEAVLDSIDLPEDDARRLMELGFLPGSRVSIGHKAPGGDPLVFRVDGSEIALRRETASKLKIRNIA